MTISEKFHIRSSNKKIRCSITPMMNLSVGMCNEDTRVSLLILNDDCSYNRPKMWMEMSRAEALTLGKTLVDYGERKLEGEEQEK